MLPPGANIRVETFSILATGLMAAFVCIGGGKSSAAFLSALFRFTLPPLLTRNGKGGETPFFPSGSKEAIFRESLDSETAGDGGGVVESLLLPSWPCKKSTYDTLKVVV